MLEQKEADRFCAVSCLFESVAGASQAIISVLPKTNLVIDFCFSSPDFPAKSVSKFLVAAK